MPYIVVKIDIVGNIKVVWLSKSTKPTIVIAALLAGNTKPSVVVTASFVLVSSPAVPLVLRQEVFRSRLLTP